MAIFNNSSSSGMAKLLTPIERVQPFSTILWGRERERERGEGRRGRERERERERERHSGFSLPLTALYEVQNLAFKVELLRIANLGSSSIWRRETHQKHALAHSAGEM